MLSKSLVVSIGLGAAFIASPAGAQISTAPSPIVRWSPTDASTLIAGSGCEKNIDAFAFVNGKDVAVVFTNLGIDLPRGSRQLSERRSCSLRIPATVPARHYVSGLEQSFTFGVWKDAGARVSVASRAALMGLAAPTTSWSVPREFDVFDVFALHANQDRFSRDSDWGRAFCASSRPEKGLYQANIAISGQREHAGQELVAFVAGLDLKYEVRLGLSRC